jgi:hypothetical protein
MTNTTSRGRDYFTTPVPQYRPQSRRHGPLQDKRPSIWARLMGRG